MSALGSVGQLDPSMTAPWTVPPPLGNVPGGETNLLHRSAWSDPVNPLRVQFKPWYDVPLPVPTPPDPPFTETVQVFLDDDENNIVVSRTWTLPMDPDDYFIEISPNHLPQGEHTFNFILTNYVGVRSRSYPYTVTIDKDAPLLNASSKLIFPPEVLPPNKLTARYLELNEDQVKCGVPEYVTASPWDRITWYWGTGPGDLNVGDVIELNERDYADPVVIVIKGELIRDRGDGPRFVLYQVEDRASNKSTYSVHVELDVDAKPIPRSLPWPSVEKAAGSGPQQTFDPRDGESGAIVVIPDTADIYPDEQAGVQWGEPGSLGEYRSLTPITDGGRRYQIPMRSIAAFIGKALPVYYFVIETGEKELPSDKRGLTIATLPIDRLPRVQCEGLSGGKLSYERVPAVGAQLTLDTWSLMTIDQHIKFRMTGIGQSGAEDHYDFPARAVTTPELSGGIKGMFVPKPFLNRLQRGRSLTGKVYVSFDGGKTWPNMAAPNFPLLQLTLIA